MKRPPGTVWTALFLLLSLAGCQTAVEAPTGDVDRRWVYQKIANALPRANFGWGEPPGIVHMSASAKKEGPAPEPMPLVANESSFTIAYSVYRTKNARIPYKAIRDVYTSWRPMPNVLWCLLPIIPSQSVLLTVVIDTKEVPGLQAGFESDIKRLEGISREIGMGGPWAFAQSVKNKLIEDAALYGPGLVGLHFGYVEFMFSWIPVGGEADLAGKAFVWAGQTLTCQRSNPKSQSPKTLL